MAPKAPRSRGAANLDRDHQELIHALVAALARRQPSPLRTGQEPSCRPGVVHAIGAAHTHAKKGRDLVGLPSFSAR